VLKVRNTSINQIPNNWEITKTGNICTSIVPGRNKPKQFNGDIPWITITDLENQFWISESKAGLAVSREELQKAKGKTVPFGTVIMTCVGNFGIAGIAEKELVINQQLHGLICSEKVLPEYLCHVLRSKEKEMLSLAGRTTVLYLNSSKCESINILLPPIAEQRKIAEILGTWDKAIALTEKLIAAKLKRKKALMQKLLTDKIRFYQSVLKKGQWLHGRFADVAEIIMGQSPDGSTYNQEGVGMPLLNGPTEFGQRFPTKIQWTNEPTKNCKEGDILLCVRGSSTGRINIANYEYCIGRGIAAIRAKKSRSITSYLEQQLIYGVQKILALTSGSTFPNIDKKSIEKIPIIIPTIEEQEYIAAILSLADKEIHKLQKQTQLLQTQKRGLMQKLLTGEWRVKIEKAGQQLAETKT
jgi:type I restriction enzyme, S subunit